MNYPTPTQLKNGLKGNTVSIVHGHGNTGFVACKNEQGNNYGYLYASKYSTANMDDRLSDLSSTALSGEKLVMYLTCYSATYKTGETSMMQETYNRGAKCVIAFTNSVAGAEYWAYYLVQNINDGSTINTAIMRADNLYELYYPNQALQSDSPTKGRTSIGDRTQKLK